MNVWSRLLPKRKVIKVMSESGRVFEPTTEHMVTSAPKILWIELTSRCPFKCVFCTREVRWGAGQNMDFEIYRSLVEQLEEPEFIGLNYSGESIHYPRLIDAIELACATGAYTELVTALSSASESLVQRIVESDLDRLAVSIHTLDDMEYRDIYGFGSLQGLRKRIDQLNELKARLRKRTPKLDFCFVAMSRNLDQLPALSRYAREVGASEIVVHPVIGRHPVPYDFSRELNSNKLTANFKESLRQALTTTRIECPGVPVTVLNPDLDLNPQLHSIPRSYAPALPAGGRIHTCDQSPFESAHVLASGDVVVCEVHDEIPMGNLHFSRLGEIWHSGRYRRFREEYVAGLNPGCRNCVWKTAYRPSLWKAAIQSGDGFSPQLTRGWWIEAGNTAIWSKKTSVAELRADSKVRHFRIAGILPHDPATHSNELIMSVNNLNVASIANSTAQFQQFDRTFPLRTADERLLFEFVTSRVFRPSAHSSSPDCRDLGFALQHLELQ